MKNSTRGLVAGGLGVALLTGGATFALWSDSESIDGGTITAGNLDIALTGSQWYDVSADRTDSPHTIDLSTFRIVPGDTIRGDYKVDAALAGDNMMAQLKIAHGRITSDLLSTDNGVTLTYRILDSEGTQVSGISPVNGSTSLSLRASEDNSNNKLAEGGIPGVGNTLTLPAELGGDPDITVEITAKFDADTPAQVRTQATALLADFTVSLEQVRTKARGFVS
jgi:alternate signal-mediated exported protein